MILSDFLSGQKIDDSNLCEIIPIAFNMRDVLHERYYNFHNTRTGDKYLVQSRSQTKSSGIRLPEILGIGKGLDPYVRPERQKPINSLTDMRPPVCKPRIGQSRAGVRRTARIILPSQPSAPATKSMPETAALSQETVQTEHKSPAQTDFRQPVGPGIEARQIPFYPDLILRPPPRLSDLKENRRDLLSDLDTDINIDFEENFHIRKVLFQTHMRPDKSYIKEPPELKDLLDTTKIMLKFLPKQTDIDKILDMIWIKSLKGTHLPITVKEIQAGYLTSPYFKDLYLYLAQNKLPSKKGAICKVEALVERFILIDSLLFKLVTTPDREIVLLTVPEICADKIITLYHTSLFAGHQGVIKMYLTIGDKFFIPGLMHYLRSLIKGCHIYQSVRKYKLPIKQLQNRIYLNYRPLSRLHMDLKVMLRLQKRHRYILCIIDEVTNCLITVPIYQSKSEEIGEALIENVILKYCVPDYLIMDQDSAFMSTLMNYLFKKFGIKVKTVVLYIHQSLKAEHGIKSLSSILTKHLTDHGQMWHKYLPLATIAYNTFNSPNLGNYSPYELVFGRKPKLLLDLEIDPEMKISGMYREYYALLSKRLQYLHKLL